MAGSERVALITGCSSGFGLLAATRAAQAGFTVYAGVRRPESADAVRTAAGGLDVRPIQLDVTDDAQRRAAVAQILDAHGRLDGLVNNAGRPLGGFLEDLDEDELRALFDVNVFAIFSLTNLVLPTLRAQRSGVIINVSSMAGRMAMPGLGAYAASKFALEGMTEALSREVRPFGVRVALVEPGPYKTDIFDRNRILGRRATDPASPYAAMSARMDATAKAVAERAGDPDDVAVRIVKLLEGSKGGLRHPMGTSAHARLLAKAVLPSFAIEGLIGRVIGRPE